VASRQEIWVSARAAALGGTPEAHVQAKGEWDRAHALLDDIKRAEPSRPKVYGRGGKPIEFDGEVRTLSEWARHLGLLKTTLHVRIKRWGLERALRTPARRYLKD
jgi:hypothetical protein